MDDNDDDPWGGSLKGQRCVALKPGHRNERISFVAALHQRQMIAPMVFTGHCNRAVFTVWLERVLLPLLQPGHTILLDNARFHQVPTLATTLANAGCTLRYLPPYSPDLNPIEHYWAPLKNRIRKCLPPTTSFFETVCDACT